MKNNQGFTLIEVLVALVILAISLMALLKASGENINNTIRIENKIISELVMKQGITMLKLGIIPLANNQETSHVTTILKQKLYWRTKRSSTKIPHMYQITVSASLSNSGPWQHQLIAYGLDL